MDDQDDLCAECARVDPVGALDCGESLPGETFFTLADDRQCMFCNLCIGALNSTRAAVGEPCLEGQVRVALDVERLCWSYETDDKPTCYTNWASVSIVDDDPESASPNGRPVNATTDSIYIQIIRDADGRISDRDCYSYGCRVYDEIDLGLVKLWMSQCASGHGDRCKSLPLRPDLPEYLVDTSALMLVPKTGHPRYAAVSYCWGNEQVPQLRLKDLKELAPDQDAWSIDGRWTEVPQTIKDAMLLCQRLSIPYLWVDALCILHDRPAQSELCDTHLAQQMRSIYESADLAIVAAAGDDSWAGLPGVRAGTRSVGQHVARLEDVVLANVLGSPYEVIPHFDFRSGKQILLNFPELNRHEHYRAYVEILEDYTGRRLTYQQDALEAFGGIASFLSRAVATSFLWGMPLRFFEQALLFQPGSKSRAPLTRRRQFPSWSWVGWQVEADGDFITCDSWVGTRGVHWWLDDFWSVNEWFRFKRATDGGLMEFEVVQGIENPREGGGAGLTHRIVKVPSSCHPSHVLLVDAMAARLDLRRHQSNQDADCGAHLVSLYFPGGDRELGTVRLGAGWNEGQALSFVAIAQETQEVGVAESGGSRRSELKEVIHTLLVETGVGGMSERRHMYTLDKADWDAAGPKRQTIFLV
ncbi:hypothetical protein MAPG_09292 [Magnaporthiopsis poae ATCC 64411]|uniref:Heterokaryon incompatibility domain-containing protein n=1 Tax=Magnaporthiopsis poae (strain ATCC 64411 / 73-15) TaxID=644358 RepID=A0A0C4E9J9_MAGP6|nr:hypothetical protein MAPG_09292 [Magnaporthiopsis poae ATCC 64411]